MRAQSKAVNSRVIPKSLYEPPARRLYSYAEAAQIIGIKPRTVRDWVRRGVLETSVVAGRRRVLASSVDAVTMNED